MTAIITFILSRRRTIFGPREGTLNCFIVWRATFLWRTIRFNYKLLNATWLNSIYWKWSRKRCFITPNEIGFLSFANRVNSSQRSSQPRQFYQIKALLLYDSLSDLGSCSIVIRRVRLTFRLTKKKLLSWFDWSDFIDLEIGSRKSAYETLKYVLRRLSKCKLGPTRNGTRRTYKRRLMCFGVYEKLSIICVDDGWLRTAQAPTNDDRDVWLNLCMNSSNFATKDSSRSFELITGHKYAIQQPQRISSHRFEAEQKKITFHTKKKWEKLDVLVPPSNHSVMRVESE